MKSDKPMQAIFLDRDGTINVDFGYAYLLSDFAFERNAVDGLKALRDAGFTLFIITNQSGIARGLFTEKDFERFNSHLVSELATEGIVIEKTYFCPFHPDAVIEKYRLDSPLRKPGTGMLELAASEYAIDKSRSFVIGDKASDIAAGKRFGIRTVLLSTGKSGKDSVGMSEADHTADDLFEAARYIIDND
ncbi:MAG TPA: HAD family hydrolase [Candidatus Fimivivens sp.]|nr:HAD family hydrolase [Candidatus Fimivivens sp.]